ncbi:hypothetical protein BH10BAC5_BH10BAC5_11420 [soil metagenome]
MPDKNTSVFICGDLAPVGKVKPQAEIVTHDLKKVISDSSVRIVNLECPLTNSSTQVKKSGPPLKASPEQIKILTNIGFNVAALANNHIMDLGEEGISDTISICRNNNIETVGAGKNAKEASKILYLHSEGLNIGIINLCEQEFSIAFENIAGANPADPVSAFYQIREAKERSDYVLVIFHGGHEYYNLPSLRIKKLFRYFADCGADAVIGHHPHRIGGYEVYEGKPLFYSLGNFLFDDDNEPEFWYEGIGVNLIVSRHNTVEFSIYPFEQCKGEPEVKLMNENDRNRILLEIEKLNEIIADDGLLEKNWKEFAGRSSDNIIKNLMNMSRAKRLLYNKNIFKESLINEEHLINLLNLTRCESLRDVTIYSVKNKLNLKN